MNVELNGYEDFEVIGSGGNAHVYRATEVESGETVAVKVLRGGGDEAVTRRFERERTLMAELETITNVVPIHQAGFSDTGDPYLIMPLYTGGSLQDLVDDGPMPWEEAVDLARMLTESIALAHAKRILHLDVKPANVLLDDDGEPWLSDFGIAEMMGHTASMSAQMMTPAFTPPERFDGAKPGEATDLYGLVATLYALLAGRPPYVTADMTGPMAVMLAITRDPLPLDALPDDLPQSVRNLLRRGMAKDPAERPRSAIQLVGLLEDALDGRPIAPPVSSVAVTDDRSVVPVVAADAVMTSEVAAPDTSGTILRPQPVSQELLPAIPIEAEPRRRVAVLAGLLLLVLLGGGAAAAMLLSNDGDEPEVAAVDDAVADTTESTVEEPASTESSTDQATDGLDEPEPLGADEVPEVDESGLDVDRSEDPADESEESQGVLAASVTAAPPTTAGDSSQPTTSTTEQSTTSTTEATSTSTTTTSTSTTTTSTSTTTTTTTPLPEIEAGFVAQGGATGSEQTVSFRSITVGDATSFAWDFGDGSRGTGERVTHTYAEPGTYAVTITARGDGVSDSATHTVRVEANTPNLEAGFRASPGPAGSEQTIAFTNITVGDATTWRWDFGDGSTSVERAPTHRYASPGTYSVTLTASGPDGSDTATHTVRVEADEMEFEAGWTASAGASPNQQTVTFRSTTIGDANSFEWDFGDGALGSGQSVTHTYAEPGTYSVTLTASGPGGVDTATHSVRVDANG